MAAATDQTGAGTPTGGSTSADALDAIIQQLTASLGGGAGSQTLSGNPWDVTFALNAPVYTRQAAPRPLVNGKPLIGPYEGETKVVPSQVTGADYLQTTLAKTMDPHAVSELQARLAKLGMLAPDTYNVGDGTDAGTQQAMAGVLRVAALKGMTPDDALNYLEKVTPPSQTLAGQEKAKQQSESQARAKAAYDSYIGSLQSVYMRTWGTPPPPGYVDRAAKSGMNIYEFEAHERSKPAFEQSAQGQTERLNIEAQIAQWMGRGA
jgi:hypothetical protein